MYAFASKAPWLAVQEICVYGAFRALFGGPAGKYTHPRAPEWPSALGMFRQLPGPWGEAGMIPIGERLTPEWVDVALTPEATKSSSSLPAALEGWLRLGVPLTRAVKAADVETAKSRSCSTRHP
jgi:hypothetical protein